MKLIHLTKRYRAAPLDTGINLALNPFFNGSWVEELKPYNMIGTPRDTFYKERNQHGVTSTHF